MIRLGARVMSLLLAVFPTVSAAAAAQGGPDAASLDRPDARWRQGPAKYLLSKDEDSQFRKLKSDEERKTFIEGFWARRDPSPGTPQNEFRDLFAKRLALAEEKFGGRGGRGWEDDRGMALILIGPPDSVEEHQSDLPDAGPSVQGPPGAGSPDAGVSPSAPRRRETYIYKRAVVPGASVPLRLEFSEEQTGQFRLVSKFDFSDPRITGLTPLPLPAAPPPPPAAAATPVSPPAPEPMPEAIPVPPTPEHALMEEILSGPTPSSKLPVAARLDFFKTSAESETLLTLTVALKKPAQGDVATILGARLTGPDDKTILSFEKDDSFAPAAENTTAPAGGDLLFQAVHNIAPGKYSLVAAVKDTKTNDIGFVLQNVEVPEYKDPGLCLSSVTLARKVERLAGTAAPSARFVFGSSKVIPAPRPVFKAGEDVWLYYQVYNTANDPASGHPKIKITYRWEKVEKAGNRLLGGRPIEVSADSNVQAYSVTVQSAWPAGDYQVVVKVDDVVASTSATAKVPFSVVK